MGKMNGIREKTDREKEEVLVTGGGGFLGRAIIKKLVERGDEVRSLSRNRYPFLEKLGVKQFEGDIRDVTAVFRACRGTDVVYHTAAKAGVWGKFDEYYGINVIGTINVADACRRLGHIRMIYTSSPSVVFNGSDMEGVDETVPYPKDYSADYPRTKARAEQFVQAAVEKGLPAIIFRPHLIWGPEDNHLVPRILQRRKQLSRIGAENKLVDTVFIDNAAHAHILGADQLKINPELSGRTYFISQDEPIPLWDMVNKILDAGGYPPIRKNVSVKTAKFIAGLFEWTYKIFGITREPRLTRFVVDELSTAHWFDISAAKNDLGYKPIVSTEAGLKILSEYLESRKNNHFH